MILEMYMKEMQYRLKKKFREYVKCSIENAEEQGIYSYKLRASLLITDQCNDHQINILRAIQHRELNLVDLEEFEINVSRVFETFLEGI